MTTILKPSYTGSAPTASNTQVLFSTVAAGWPAKLTQMNGLELLLLDIVNSHSGTLKLYKSQDHGTSWKQVGERAVTAGTTNSNFLDFDISAYEDWKIEWVNGGTNQTTWVVDIALSSERFGIQSPDETFGTDLTLWLEPEQALTPDDATLDPDVAGSWTFVNCSNGGATADPGGGSDAIVITDSADGGIPKDHAVTKPPVNFAPTRTRSLDVWLQAGTLGWSFVGVSGGTSGAYVNLTTGAIGTLTGGATASVIDAVGSWYQVRVTGPGTVSSMLVYPAVSNGGRNYAGDGTGTIHVGTITYGPVMTQRRIIGLADQGAGGHDASQAIDASQPLYGADALGAQKIADFDGTDDYMTLAAGSGWSAKTSHSFFALINPTAPLGSFKYWFDASTGRLVLAMSGNVANKVGWFDGSFRNIADNVGGWQILEWHLDADTNVGEIIRTSATSSVSLGTAFYTPRAIGGTVRLNSDSGVVANHADHDFGSLVLVSRATGHPVGVTTAAERAAERNRLRRLAQKLGVAL